MNERGECAFARLRLTSAGDRHDGTTSTTTTNDTTQRPINTQLAVSERKDSGPENGPTDGVHLPCSSQR